MDRDQGRPDHVCHAPGVPSGTERRDMQDLCPFEQLTLSSLPRRLTASQEEESHSLGSIADVLYAITFFFVRAKNKKYLES